MTNHPVINYDDGTFTPTEVVDPDSTRSLYEEALKELNVSDRDAAKTVLAAQIKEVERLKGLLTKAEERLEELLGKTPKEIAELDCRSGRFLITQNPVVRWGLSCGS
jgi:hypothetical protein